MSVLIRGMEMPKNCDECYFVGYGYPDWCGLPQIPNGKDEIVDINTRPDWCPLVELPANHGPLIDQRATVNRLSRDVAAYGQSALPMMIAVSKTIEDVKRMPVVVEED